MRLIRREILLVAAAACIGTPVLAQSSDAPVTVPVVAEPAPSGPMAGPTFENLRAGYSETADAPLTMTEYHAASSSKKTGQVLAIVGGAAVIGGLLIGDDAGTAIAVGGLVMGLIGLYMWLK